MELNREKIETIVIPALEHFKKLQQDITRRLKNDDLQDLTWKQAQVAENLVTVLTAVTQDKVITYEEQNLLKSLPETLEQFRTSLGKLYLSDSKEIASPATRRGTRSEETQSAGRDILAKMHIVRAELRHASRAVKLNQNELDGYYTHWRQRQNADMKNGNDDRERG